MVINHGKQIDLETGGFANEAFPSSFAALIVSLEVAGKARSVTPGTAPRSSIKTLPPIQEVAGSLP